MLEKLGKFLLILSMILNIYLLSIIIKLIVNNFNFIVDFIDLIKLGIVGSILIILSAYLQIMNIENIGKKEGIIKKNIILLFILYILLFSIAIFFKSGMGLFYETDNYLLYLKNNYNIIPLKTISYYIRGYINNEILFINLFYNIIGNIIISIPMGIFLYILFKKLRKFKNYFITLTAIIIIVEVLQLLTKTGYCDIDDYILNILGCILGFYILTNKKINNILKNNYIL